MLFIPRPVNSNATIPGLLLFVTELKLPFTLQTFKLVFTVFRLPIQFIFPLSLSRPFSSSCLYIWINTCEYVLPVHDLLNDWNSSFKIMCLIVRSICHKKRLFISIFLKKNIGWKICFINWPGSREILNARFSESLPGLFSRKSKSFLNAYFSELDCI